MTRRDAMIAMSAGMFVFREEATANTCDTAANPLLKSGFPIHNARDFEPPSRVVERPLWSAMPPQERKSNLALLQKAYGGLVGLGKQNRRDHTSSLFQMWMHEYYCGAGRQSVMQGVEAGYNVHTNGFFLPWHRAFLFFHERLLQEQLPDAREFRLPVYDWENVSARELPIFYYGLSVIHNRCAPLYPPYDGWPTVDSCQLQAWLASDSVAEFTGGFAPKSPEPRAASGPHAKVHVGLGYLMTSMTYAAADPVFWAHHANVDRYWDHWCRSYEDTDWFKSTYPNFWPKGYFYFYDRKKRPARVSIAQVLDPEHLGYRYQRPAVSLNGLVARPVELTGIPDPGQFAPVYDQILRGLHVDRNPGTVAETGAPLVVLATKYLDCYRQFQPVFSIPGYLTGSVSGVQEGVYYLLAVESPDGNDTARIGGFGVFHAGHTHEVVATFCMTAKAMALIAECIVGRLPVRLVCGKADAAGENPMRPYLQFSSAKGVLRLPKDPNVI